jgi:hypothetical protein
MPTLAEPDRAFTEEALRQRGLGAPTIEAWLRCGYLSRGPDGTFAASPIALDLMEAIGSRRRAPAVRGTPQPLVRRRRRRVNPETRRMLRVPPALPLPAVLPREEEHLYRDLPMPPRWFEALRARSAPWQADTFVNVPELDVLLRRARGETLEEIAKPLAVTRERVRQIEQRAQRGLRAHGGLEELRPLLIPSKGELFRAVRVTDEASVRLSTWLLGRTLRLGVRLVRVGPIGWLVVDMEQHALGAESLMAFLRANRIAYASDLKALLAVSEERMLMLPELFPFNFRLTSAGWIALPRWAPGPRDCVAVARFLAKAGFVEWHFSQLRKAVQVLRGDGVAPRVLRLVRRMTRSELTIEVSAAGSPRPATS